MKAHLQLRYRADESQEPARQPKRVRVAAVATCPGYYHAPLFRQVAQDPRVDLTVIYASDSSLKPHGSGFGSGTKIVWDTDQLGGYHYRFVSRASLNLPNRGFWRLRDTEPARLLFHGKYDVVWVHGHAYLSLWFAMAAARLRRVPVLLREEQTLLRRRAWPKRWIRAAILRGLFSQVVGLYISSNNRDFFERYGIPPEKLFFVPYAVENDVFQEQARQLAGKKPTLRRQFGIAADTTAVILFVGKFNHDKNPELLVDAFRSIREHIKCSLLLIGDGELGPELRDRARGIPDVHFGGVLNRSEVPSAYAAADILVLPSRSDTFGLVVAEAMNFGLPVVVSDAVGCARDLVRPGENGFVVTSEDVSALASRLGELVLDADLRTAFGTRSRDLIEAWNHSVAAAGIVSAATAAARPSAK